MFGVVLGVLGAAIPGSLWDCCCKKSTWESMDCHGERLACGDPACMKIQPGFAAFAAHGVAAHTIALPPAAFHGEIAARMIGYGLDRPPKFS